MFAGEEVAQVKVQGRRWIKKKKKKNETNTSV